MIVVNVQESSLLSSTHVAWQGSGEETSQAEC